MNNSIIYLNPIHGVILKSCTYSLLHPYSHISCSCVFRVTLLLRRRNCNESKGKPFQDILQIYYSLADRENPVHMINEQWQRP